MTRPTTITLSFLLVLLVIAGMYVKTKIENDPRQIVDSLAKHPEITTNRNIMKGYEAVVSEAKRKGWTDSTIHIVSVEGSGYTTAPVGDYAEYSNSDDCIGYPINHVKWVEDTLKNWFPNHSKIPTR